MTMTTTLAAWVSSRDSRVVVVSRRRARGRQEAMVSTVTPLPRVHLSPKQIEHERVDRQTRRDARTRRAIHTFKCHEWHKSQPHSGSGSSSSNGNRVFPEPTVDHSIIFATGDAGRASLRNVSPGCHAGGDQESVPAAFHEIHPITRLTSKAEFCPWASKRLTIAE